MTPTDLECCYAAGFFDGEGTIGIRVENRVTNRVHVLQIGIGNTDRRPLDWIAEHFGGVVRGPVRRPAPCKPIYFWQLGASRAEWFIRQVRPYLITKAAQADVALELRALPGRQGVRITEQQLAERDSLKVKITALNHRGIAKAVGVSL